MCTQHIPNTNERNLTKLNILHHAVQVIMQLEDQVINHWVFENNRLSQKTQKLLQVFRITFFELIEENRISHWVLSGRNFSSTV
jgi:ribosomal protein S16